MSKRPKIQYGSPTGGATTAAAAQAPGRPKGVMIAVGAAVLAVVIVIAIFAVQDGGGANVNKTAFQTLTITGDALPPLDDSGTDAAIGLPAPVINGKDFDGNPVTLDPSEPTFVVFMTHWCGHCQAEVPRIVEAVNNGELSSEVKIVGVSTSANELSGNFPPASWLEKEDWGFPTIVDNRLNEAMTTYGLSAFPSLVAIKADGTIAARTSGEQSLEQLQRLFAAALGEGSDVPVPTGESSDLPEADPAE